jgi:uncharacterized membrane protein
MVRRLLKHAFALPGGVQRAFGAAAMRRIESAIRQSEARHGGEIRFAVEAALDPLAVWRGMTARERAIEVFSELRVWDTEGNNGVLVYLLLADRDVEIVADRGVDRRFGGAEWEEICRAMERHFAAGRYEEGVLAGIAHIGAHLERHFPRAADDVNELPDQAARVK